MPAPNWKWRQSASRSKSVQVPYRLGRVMNRFCLSLSLGLIALFILAACGQPSPSPESSTPTTPSNADPVTPEPSILPSPTASEVSTSTPLPGRVILLAPPGSDEELAAALQASLAGAAAEAGLSFEMQTGPALDAAGGEARLVIVLAPDPGIAGMAASYPETQFLAVGIPGLQPSSNLSLVGPQGPRPDQHGFMAGMIAAVLTDDWRVGVLNVADTPGGKAAKGGFLNGAIFFCGLCRPAFPPFNFYPLYSELPAGASLAEWQAAADALIGGGVKTAYVDPQIGQEELLNYLAQAGVKLILSQPPPQALRQDWAATLRSDPTALILEIMPQLLEGQGGMSLPWPVEIAEANPDLFSPGRQRYVQDVLADLLAGSIDSGVDPLTGESR